MLRSIETVNMTMRNKITTLILLAGVIPLLVVVAAAHFLAQDSQVDTTLSRLESVRSAKKSEVEAYFAQHKKDISQLLLDVGNMGKQDFSILEKLRQTNQRRLTDYFTEQTANITTLAANEELAQSMATIDWVYRQAGKRTDGSKWTQIVDKRTSWLDRYVETHALVDLYLVSVRGDVFFTTGRGPVLGTNLNEAPAANGPLGQLFGQALTKASIQDQSTDLKKNPTPLTYIGVPVNDGGKTVGVVIVALSLQKVLDTILVADGLGPDGVVYLVGPDKQLRSNLIFDSTGKETNQPDSLTLNPLAVDLALSGQSGSKILTNGDQLRLTAWGPVTIGRNSWALIVESKPSNSIDPAVRAELDQKYRKNSGYYDLFLIRPDGLVFHTAAHQKDFGTNLLTGSYADSNLAQLLKQVLETKTIALSDVASYAPSHGEPAAFIAAPLLKNGQVDLVVALQLPLEELNQILLSGDPLGPQGDIYLVGPDKRLRSDSKLRAETHSVLASFNGSVANNGADIPAVQAALAGETGALSEEGQSRIFAYTPISIDGFTWALILESAPSTGSSHSPEMIQTLTLISLAFIPFLVLLAFIGSKKIVQPLAEFSELVAQISQGNFTTRLPAGTDLTRNRLAVQVVEMSQRLGQIALTIQSRAETLINRTQALSFAIEQGRPTSQRGAVSGTQPHPAADLIHQLELIIDQEGAPSQSVEQMAELTTLDMAKGNRSINEAVAASRDVSERIFALEEVARQIRLLAMDAAIEAARSGAPGTSFIETAKEIRELAEQSRISANEIHRLSTSSTQVTKQAGEILTGLLPAIRKSIDLIRDDSSQRNRQQAVLHQLMQQLKSFKQRPVQNSLPTDLGADPGISKIIFELNQSANQLQEALAAFILPQNPSGTEQMEKDNEQVGELF
ncbi:MAG: methyl-accepting chemotaxis protein [Magnetococcales bacterium]|nr:methyl-accepting chemotaxis protein [Magnetococcales bacterium]